MRPSQHAGVQDMQQCEISTVCLRQCKREGRARSVLPGQGYGMQNAMRNDVARRRGCMRPNNVYRDIDCSQKRISHTPQYFLPGVPVPMGADNEAVGLPVFNFLVNDVYRDAAFENDGARNSFHLDALSHVGKCLPCLRFSCVGGACSSLT